MAIQKRIGLTLLIALSGAGAVLNFGLYFSRAGAVNGRTPLEIADFYAQAAPAASPNGHIYGYADSTTRLLNFSSYGAGYFRVGSGLGTSNSVLGILAGSSLTGGSGSNTLVGSNAGAALTNASGGTHIGNASGLSVTGSNNTIIGSSSGTSLTTGGTNVIIGHTADSGAANTANAVAIGETAVAGTRGVSIGESVTSGTNSIAIGSGVTAGNNECVVGNTNSSITTYVFGNGTTNASPTASTIRATNGLGTDVAGAGLIIQPGAGTGQAIGGKLTFRTSPNIATGTTLQTSYDRYIVPARGVALQDAVATTVATWTLTNGSSGGGRIIGTIQVTNGTDFQSMTQYVEVALVNKAGTYTTDIKSTTGAKAVSAGTLTTTWTITSAGAVQLNADTSLTPSGTNSFVVYICVESNSQSNVTIP